MELPCPEDNEELELVVQIDDRDPKTGEPTSRTIRFEPDGRGHMRLVPDSKED